MTRTAWGHALLTLTDGGTVLDAWFPSPALGAPGGAGELAAPAGLEALVGRDEARGVTREVRLVTADLDTPPTDAADGWLRRPGPRGQGHPLGWCGRPPDRHGHAHERLGGRLHRAGHA